MGVDRSVSALGKVGAVGFRVTPNLSTDNLIGISLFDQE
jgi:hypothetical protein